MIKHRIKTEQEFLIEFGTNWVNKVIWNPVGDMDYLFGMEIDTPINIEDYFICHIDNWYINNKMIKLIGIDYNEKKNISI